MRVVFKYMGSATLGKLVKARVQRVRKKISESVVALWREKVASSSLSPKAQARYSEAITPYRPPEAGAYLNDFVANLLEAGWKRFDMKPGLLAGAMPARSAIGKTGQSMDIRRVIPINDNGLIKFRTVSTSSAKRSWIHPGFKGAHLAWRVKRGLARIVREAIANGGG